MGFKDELTQLLNHIGIKYGFDVTVPTDPKNGDYTTNAAMQIASRENKNPREITEQIVQKLHQVKEIDQKVSKIEVAGPGFINFWLNDKALSKNMQNILREKEDYGKTKLNINKKVIVEYSSINIAKPFTIGHLRSTIIGDAVANLMEATGWEVLRDNHVGDWGSAFGKQIYALKNLGKGSLEENIREIEATENPVKVLVKLYIEFHEKAEKDDSLFDKGREWFKKLEEGDSEARKIWKLCIEWSWKEFEKIYKLLGVNFSDKFQGGRGLGESFFEDKMPAVIDELDEKGLLKKGEGGAKLVFFDQEKYPPAMILKSNGTTLYHTRDLATDKYRKDKFDPDLIINEVGAEQKLYFEQLFEMERLLDWYKKEQRFHLMHSLIRFKEGKMSTRKGNVIWLDEVLEKAEEKALFLQNTEHSFTEDGKEVISKSKKHSLSARKHVLGAGQGINVAEDVAIGAIKYNDLKRDPMTTYSFDWDEILNMQGNSGPYLQYTYARAKSVLRKAKYKAVGSRQQAIDQKKLVTSVQSLVPEEAVLLRTLPHFPEVIAEAAERYAPNLLCNYLYELAQKFNTFYNAEKIVGGEREEFKLVLTAATAQVLQNGLGLLGIKTLEKM